jgi:hypothetical protein
MATALPVQLKLVPGNKAGLRGLPMPAPEKRSRFVPPGCLCVFRHKNLPYLLLNFTK